MGRLRGLWVYQLVFDSSCPKSCENDTIEQDYENREQPVPFQLHNIAALRYTATEKRMNTILLRREPSSNAKQHTTDWAAIPSEPEFTSLLKHQIIRSDHGGRYFDLEKTPFSEGHGRHTSGCPRCGYPVENQISFSSMIAKQPFMNRSGTSDQVSPSHFQFENGKSKLDNPLGKCPLCSESSLWPYGPFTRLVYLSTASKTKQYIYPVFFAQYNSIIVVAVPFLADLDFSCVSCCEAMNDPQIFLERPSLSRLIETAHTLAAFIDNLLSFAPLWENTDANRLDGDSRMLLPLQFVERLRQVISLIIPFGRLVLENSLHLQQYLQEIWLHESLNDDLASKNCFKKRQGNALSTLAKEPWAHWGFLRKNQVEAFGVNREEKRRRPKQHHLSRSRKTSLLHSVLGLSASKKLSANANAVPFKNPISDLHLQRTRSGFKHSANTTKRLGEEQSRLTVSQDCLQVNCDNSEYDSLLRLVSINGRAPQDIGVLPTSTTISLTTADCSDGENHQASETSITRSQKITYSVNVSTVISLSNCLPELTAIPLKTYMKYLKYYGDNDTAVNEIVSQIKLSVKTKKCWIVVLHPLFYALKRNALLFPTQPSLTPLPTSVKPLRKPCDILDRSTSTVKSGNTGVEVGINNKSFQEHQMGLDVSSFEAGLWDFSSNAASKPVLRMMTRKPQDKLKGMSKAYRFVLKYLETVVSFNFEHSLIFQQSPLATEHLCENDRATLRQSGIDSSNIFFSGYVQFIAAHTKDAFLVSKLDATMRVPCFSPLVQWALKYRFLPSESGWSVDETITLQHQTTTPSYTLLSASLTAPGSLPITLLRYNHVLIPQEQRLHLPVNATLQIVEVVSGADEFKQLEKLQKYCCSLYIDVQLNVCAAYVSSVSQLRVELPFLHKALCSAHLRAGIVGHIERHTLEADLGSVQLTGRSTKVLWTIKDLNDPNVDLLSASNDREGKTVRLRGEIFLSLKYSVLDFRHPLAESCLLSSTGKACQSPCLQLNPEQRAALGPLWDKFVELDNCSEKPPSKFIGDIGKSEDAFKHYLRSFVKNSYAEVFYTVANRSLLDLQPCSATVTVLDWPEYDSKPYSKNDNDENVLDIVQWVKGRHIMFNSGENGRSMVT